jgi:hypothetical protein
MNDMGLSKKSSVISHSISVSTVDVRSKWSWRDWVTMKHRCQQEDPYFLQFPQESTSILWSVAYQLSSTSHSLRNPLSKIKGDKPSGVPLLRPCVVGLSIDWPSPQVGDGLSSHLSMPD